MNQTPGLVIHPESTSDKVQTQTWHQLQGHPGKPIPLGSTYRKGLPDIREGAAAPKKAAHWAFTNPSAQLYPRPIQ